MTRRSLWAPLASFAVVLASGSVLAQPAPDDEPPPPSIGTPPARTSPPASTTPPPAPTTPPRTSPPASTTPPPAPTTPPQSPPSPTAPALPPSPGEAPASSAAPYEPAGTTESVPTLEATPPAPAQKTAENNDLFLPTLIGPIGLFRVSTADVGPVNHLRLALYGQYFRASNFLVEGADKRGDTNTHLEGGFVFGFTPHESIELFGAILTSSNRNVRTSEEGRRDPELIKSFGDLVLGGKGVLPIAPGFSAGAELGLRFLSSISDLAFSPDSTSLWIGAVGSADLRPLAQVPLRFHLNANFYLDNSSNLYDFTGTTIFTREVAMFAYGIAGSRLRFAIGADAPLENLTAPIPLQPFVEYHAEIITASADPAFAQYQDPSNRDQHWLTIGSRARVYKGLTLAVGLDVGLRSVGYQYGPPIPPYNVIFGAAFPLDVDAFRRPVVVTRTVESPRPPPPATGTVTGRVQSAAADGKPIADAIVAFTGKARARVATDPDGAFSSGPLAPGSVEVTVSAAGFEGSKTTVSVAAGVPTTLDLALKPKVTAGNVRGHVLDPKGKGVVASLRFAGASTFEARADASGAFSAALPPGPYKVTVEAQGWPPKEVPLDVVGGQDKQLEVTLRTANPDVTLTGRGIALRVPIRFRAGPPKLDSTAKGELDGVAEVLGEHPEIKTLRIEAHWSAPVGKAKPASVKKLTEDQANAIKDYVVSKGVPGDRIQAAGMGSDSPLVPNLGPANQAKNRRVELIIVQ